MLTQVIVNKSIWQHFLKYLQSDSENIEIQAMLD